MKGSRSTRNIEIFWRAVRKKMGSGRTLRTKIRGHVHKAPPTYRWLLHGATTKDGLAKHRTAIEKDCFPSEMHRRVLREAAAEYDAFVERGKPKGGRPRKPKPLFIPTKRQRVA